MPSLGLVETSAEAYTQLHEHAVGSYVSCLRSASRFTLHSYQRNGVERATRPEEIASTS